MSHKTEKKAPTSATVDVRLTSPLTIHNRLKRIQRLAQAHEDRNINIVEVYQNAVLIGLHQLETELKIPA